MMKYILPLTLFVFGVCCVFSAIAEEIPPISAATTANETAAPVPAPSLEPAREQSKAVREALHREASPERKIELSAVIDSIDRIYGSFRDTAMRKKIVIFFDPAHGMVKIGDHKDWQGNLTWRKSTTGKPEELYSIPICRKIYQLLTANPNIEVASTPDFLNVMKGAADIYDDVTFDESVEQAKKHDAFLILSEHLNNISPIWKADGFVNLQGCHITCDRWSTPMISYIDSVYKGYYTAYNIYDVTGASRSVANRFRDYMLERGHKNNGWDNGAVADGRFSTCINYPVSCLFESGFISNPDDERKLTTPEFIGDIAESQYKALLDTIRIEFGVDISGTIPIVDPAAESRAKNNIESIKLSRIFVNCTQKGEFANALAALSSLEKHTSTGADKWIAWPYSDMRKKIQRIASDFDTASWREKKGPLKKAAANYLDAMNAMGYHPLFNGIREIAYEKYNRLAGRLGMRHEYYNYSIGYQESYPAELQALRTNIENHPLTTPYILTIQAGESIDEAIDLSIAPSPQIRDKIVSAVKNSTTTKTVWDKYWSKKKKKYCYSKRYVKVKPDFYPGIYLMTFGKNYTVTWVSRENNIPLNPKAYQNQQFLKNSCVAERSKERAL